MAYSEKLSYTYNSFGETNEKANIALHWPKHISKKGHSSVKILRMISKFELEMYSMMHYPSLTLNEIDALLQKLLIGNHHSSHDPYVSTILGRQHKKCIKKVFVAHSESNAKQWKR